MGQASWSEACGEQQSEVVSWGAQQQADSGEGRGQEADIALVRRPAESIISHSERAHLFMTWKVYPFFLGKAGDYTRATGWALKADAKTVANSSMEVGVVFRADRRSDGRSTPLLALRDIWTRSRA